LWCWGLKSALMYTKKKFYARHTLTCLWEIFKLLSQGYVVRLSEQSMYLRTQVQNDLPGRDNLPVFTGTVGTQEKVLKESMQFPLP
jgi:hypothetical protein